MTKTFSRARALSNALVAAGFVAAAPAALANPRNDETTAPTAEVDVSKVDFTSARAVSHLIGRVRRAALDVCVGDAFYRPGLIGDEQACIDKAVRGALAQIEIRRQQAMRATAVQMAAAQPGNASHH